MDYEEMKLECLRLAIGAGATGEDVMKLADKFYNHCRGRDGNDFVGGGKARVVGKDNDIPFRDYKPE